MESITIQEQIQTRPEKLFRSQVLPVVRDLARGLSINSELSISVFLNGRRLFVEESALNSGCDSPTHQCQKGCISLLQEEGARLHKERPLPKAELSRCDSGRSTYLKRLSFPSLGTIILLACGRRDSISKRSGLKRSLDRMVNLMVRMVHSLVDWHYLSETLVHELTFIVGATSTDAERLAFLARRLKEGEPAADVDAIKEVSASLRSESEMAMYELENVLRYLSEVGDDSAASREYPGLRTPKFELVSLEKELREVIERLEYRLELRQLSLDLEGLVFDENLRIWGDRFHLRRLFYNVLGNAIKYSYRGHLPTSGLDKARERFIRVYLINSYGVDSSDVACCFENFGVGLLEGEKELIALPGYRGRLAKRDMKIGSGLGLSEAHRILDLHGGKLSIESRPVGNAPDGPQLFTAKVVLPVRRTVKERLYDYAS